MPIYAYRCATCGFANDHLQKLSDPVLSICPQCGQASYNKQVTAAGFQLKGSGWYVTDFKGGNKAAPTAVAAGKNQQDKSPGTATPATTADASKSSKSTESTTSDSAPASAKPTPAADDKR